MFNFCATDVILSSKELVGAVVRGKCKPDCITYWTFYQLVSLRPQKSPGISLEIWLELIIF